jgi:hypothetical protein
VRDRRADMIHTEKNRISSDSVQCTPLSAVGNTFELRPQNIGAGFVSAITIFKVLLLHPTLPYAINTNRMGPTTELENVTLLMALARRTSFTLYVCYRNT